MTRDEAVKHYGNQTKLGQALGVKQSTVSGWKECIPPIHQLRLQKLTRGKLKADETALKPARKEA